MAQDKREKIEPNSVTVDGLEGDIARVETEPGQTHDTPLTDLPAGVREGDVLRKVGDHLEIDQAETERRRDQAQASLDKLNATQPAGEIDL